MAVRRPETAPVGEPMMPADSWRAACAGFLLPLGLGLQAMAAFSPFVPDGAAQFAATLARMSDSLIPGLYLASLLPALALALVGWRRAGLLLAVLAMAGLFWIAADYRRMSAPAGETPDLKVLWFNMLYLNPRPPEELVQALLDSEADVVMLAEASPIAKHVEALSERYPYRLGCQARCNLLILSRYPLSEGLSPNGSDPTHAKVLSTRLSQPGHAPVDLLAVHMLKPWYLGFTLVDDERLYWIFRRYKGAVVMAGDFNAAPWSRRMRLLHRDQGLGFSPWPVASWPAEAGAAGIPIDHVLLRGGPRFVSMKPWGGAMLGSNHRGLIAEIDLSGADNSATGKEM